MTYFPPEQHRGSRFGAGRAGVRRRDVHQLQLRVVLEDIRHLGLRPARTVPLEGSHADAAAISTRASQAGHQDDARVHCGHRSAAWMNFAPSPMPMLAVRKLGSIPSPLPSVSAIEVRVALNGTSPAPAATPAPVVELID